jgi:hypothetical protein
MRFQLLIAAALLSYMPAAQAAYTITIEAPGVLNSTSVFSAVGVERFDSRNTGVNQTFTSNFGGSIFSGTYTGVRVNNADQYGGAGGTGRYVVQFGTPGFTLDVTSSQPGGVTYFGFWLSALDNGNTVRFFNQGVQLFSVDATVLRNFVNSQPNRAAYYCNPNPGRTTQNCGEPYAFLNFYAHGGTSFDRIVFDQVTGGGYESDNHTVGRWRQLTGTYVPVPGSTLPGDAMPNAVPEPAAWAMLVGGFGLVGGMQRRRRRCVVA